MYLCNIKQDSYDNNKSLVIRVAIMAQTAGSVPEHEARRYRRRIPGGGTNVKLKEGVHRIEVSFKGSADWRASLMFVATYHDESSQLYENGKKVGITSGLYSDGGIRDYAIESDAKCDDMSLAISLNPLVVDDPGEMEVTLKGYVDGKQTNMKVYTFKRGGYTSAVFYAENYGADYIR